jgi:hypothetical protein
MCALSPLDLLVWMAEDRTQSEGSKTAGEAEEEKEYQEGKGYLVNYKNIARPGLDRNTPKARIWLERLQDLKPTMPYAVEEKELASLMPCHGRAWCSSMYDNVRLL